MSHYLFFVMLSTKEYLMEGGKFFLKYIHSCKIWKTERKTGAIKYKDR